MKSATAGMEGPVKLAIPGRGKLTTCFAGGDSVILVRKWLNPSVVNLSIGDAAAFVARLFDQPELH